jgi:hypothetical protein
MGRPTVRRLSSSIDRGEVWCLLGSPYRPPLAVGGDTRCRSGVVPLPSVLTSPTSPPSMPTAAAHGCTWHRCSRTRHSSSRARLVAFGTQPVAQDTFLDRASLPAIWGTKCAGAGRRHIPLLLTVPREVSKPLATEAAWRQLAYCHHVRGGERIQALPVKIRRIAGRGPLVRRCSAGRACPSGTT